MKTDVELKNDVSEALLWEPMVTSADIVINAHKGVVTLSGTVPYYAEKLAAERATQRVNGVKAIVESLEVSVTGAHKRKDTDLAQAVVNALSWHVWVPDSVQATVEKGWVTLTGTVDWEYQRNASEEALKYLSGVTGIVNNISLKAGVKPEAIKSAIEKALKRNAEVDADRVKVSTDGGKVKLTGTVGSWTEREECGSAAWGTPAVMEVENEIAVSY